LHIFSFIMTTDSAAPKPLVANEGIKTASRHLRGNLKAEFADLSTPTVSADSEQLIKFHGTYQQDDRDQRVALKKAGKDKAYSFMLRVRLPGGKATAQQWLVLDDLATQLASPSLRLTTRQTFQFHGVVKGNMKPLIQGMHKVLLDSIAACGDVNRNVMGPVNPEQSPVQEQVYQDAKHWSDYALPKTRAYHEIWLDEELVAGGEPEIETMYGSTYLPRKFKTGFAVPPSNDIDVYSQDLGYIAIIEDGKLVGYNVTRLVLGPAIRAIEQPDAAVVARVAATPISPTRTLTPTIGENDANELLRFSIDDLRTPEQFIAWGRAKFERNPESEDAVYALERATDHAPGDRKAIENLVLAALYIPAPKGFRLAIRCAQRYLDIYQHDHAGNANLYAFLACAFGQAHRYEVETNGSVDAIESWRRRAIEASAMAVKLDPNWKPVLRSLANPPANDGENDLEGLKDDADLEQQLAGEPSAPRAPRR